MHLADPISNLGYQFLREATPSCLDACDFNDDGKTDLMDAFANLGFQLLDGNPRMKEVPSPLSLTASLCYSV